VSIADLPLLAPALMAMGALAAFLFRPGRTRYLLKIAECSAIGAFLVAMCAAIQLAVHGSVTSPLIGIAGVGLSVRLDALSVSMLLLVSFIGWVVLRYSAVFLDGEARHGSFIGSLCMTLASVLLLVSAGNLHQLLAAWVASSLFLQQLLLFYPDRIAARRAARKKFISARAADAALVCAAAALYLAYGTSDIASILQHARAGQGGGWAQLAAALLGTAALLKAGQFPSHGWLTEVMEAPTPVSALLHAGVINAGGFLLIRCADVMLLAPGVLAVLVVIGGFTAILASLVMLTQTAVKTSLAWSTVAQMGFMILECGLALFPLALLHIWAHSLYKAHAFLASGGTVGVIAANRRPGAVAVPQVGAVARAFLAALAIYALVGLAFGFSHKSPQSIALGAVLIFGVAYLLAQGLAADAPWALTWRTSTHAVAASLSYFALQTSATRLTADLLPPVPTPGPLEWALIVLVLTSFGPLAILQAMFPLWADHPAAAGLRVHLSNGLYANAVFDRMLGGWAIRKPS